MFLQGTLLKIYLRDFRVYLAISESHGDIQTQMIQKYVFPKFAETSKACYFMEYIVLCVDEESSPTAGRKLQKTEKHFNLVLLL